MEPRPVSAREIWLNAGRAWALRTREAAAESRSREQELAAAEEFTPAARTDVGEVLLAVRRSRRLSQRQLAEIAGIDRSIITRIEAGERRQPSFTSIERIVIAAGYRFLIVNQMGRPLFLQHPDNDLFDAAGRRFAAHLTPRWVAQHEWVDPWWGWYRRRTWNREVGFWAYTERSRMGNPSWWGWLDAT